MTAPFVVSYKIIGDGASGSAAAQAVARDVLGAVVGSVTYIVLYLTKSFIFMTIEGQATGETFNAAGKTDILLRIDGKNVFIGECKFWKGPKAFRNS